MKKSTKYSKEFADFVYHLQQFEQSHKITSNVIHDVPIDYVCDDNYPLGKQVVHYEEIYDNLSSGEIRYLDMLHFFSKKIEAEKQEILEYKENRRKYIEQKEKIGTLQTTKTKIQQPNRYTTPRDFYDTRDSNDIISFFIINKNINKQIIKALINRLNTKSNALVTFDAPNENTFYPNFYVLKTSKNNIIRSMIATPLQIRVLEKKYNILDGQERTINTPINLELDHWIAGYIDASVFKTIDKNELIKYIKQRSVSKIDQLLSAGYSTQYNKQQSSIDCLISNKTIEINGKTFFPILLNFNSEKKIDTIKQTEKGWQKKDFVDAISKRMCALQSCVDEYIAINLNKDPKELFLIPTSPIAFAARTTKNEPSVSVQKTENTKNDDFKF